MKAVIIIPEPLKKLLNLSMTTEDQDFLICQISSSGEDIMWESAELRRELVGRRSLQSSWGFTRVLTFTNTQHPGLRETFSCGTSNLGSYCLPSELYSQTMSASFIFFRAKSARLSLSHLQQWLKETLLNTLKCIWPICTICYGVWVQEVAGLAPYDEGK